jgi:hypothetical protein
MRALMAEENLYIYLTSTLPKAWEQLQEVL